MNPVDTWQALDPGDLSRSWGVPLVEAHATISSTSDRAAELATEGAPAWTVVVADAQTAGRGRRGASWHSASGAGLWMSLLVEEQAVPQLPLIVGVAAAEAIESVVAGVSVAVKWPNDLLVDSRKVGGILCERRGGRTVVGLGVNIRRPQGGWGGELDSVAIALAECAGETCSKEVLAGAVLEKLRAALAETDPWGVAAEQLAKRDALSGRFVVTEAEGRGVAAGVTEAGGLLLERPDGTRVEVIAGGVEIVPDPRMRA
jgi:BirA family biotin operon repressor/biotin-[acetyl-CoA-carboxylase] ligase